LTLINPSMTGLASGVTTPVLTGAPVVITVLPDAASTLSSPTGDVMVEVPAGAVERPTEFSYTSLEVESVPARLDGFTLTDKVFELSVMDTDGRTLEGPVTLGQPITVKVRIDTRDVALAGGDESRILIQHYHQDEGWEVLETSVVRLIGSQCPSGATQRLRPDHQRT